MDLTARNHQKTPLSAIPMSKVSSKQVYLLSLGLFGTNNRNHDNNDDHNDDDVDDDVYDDVDDAADDGAVD